MDDNRKRSIEETKSMEDDDTLPGVEPHPDANPDPVTGAAGSHPVGTSVGAAGGAAAGAAVGGAVGGPAGALVGGTIGAVAGGAAGHAAGEALDPTIESEYWRENYRRRPYYEPGTDYSAYEPAYRYGWESASHPDYRERPFEDAEPDLERRWRKRAAGHDWNRSREAVRDAWERVRGRS